jgi:MFS family permease
MKISPTIIYTIIVSLGGFIFGFDASVISGTLNFIVTEFNLTSIEQGYVDSAPTLGAIIPTVTAGI